MSESQSESQSERDDVQKKKKRYFCLLTINSRCFHPHVRLSSVQMPLVYAMTNSWSRAMVDRRKIIAVPSHCRCNWPFGLPSLPADSVRCPCALSLNHCARHVKTAMMSPQLPVNNTFFSTNEHAVMSFSCPPQHCYYLRVDILFM